MAAHLSPSPTPAPAQHSSWLDDAVHDRFVPGATQLAHSCRRLPARIITRRVTAASLAHSHPPQPSSPPKRLRRSKVAGTRENAKRFLRSVIAHPSASSQDSTSPAPGSSTNDNRRSWSPTRRSEGSQPPSMRTSFRNSIAGPVQAQLPRPRMLSETPSTTSSQTDRNSRHASPAPTLPSAAAASSSENVINSMNLDNDKPVASGNGVSVGIRLAEPVLYLQGFESSDSTTATTVMLRGSLHLRVQKLAKIKSVALKFKGTAVTKWPEGIPPRKIEFEERDTLMSHTWPFFNAQFEGAEKGTNADHVKLFRGAESTGGTSTPRQDAVGRANDPISSLNLTSKEAKKLALAVNQSRSFGKGDAPQGSSVVAKGYRTFLPGDYIYNFELPLDSRLPETIDVELGSVRYELEATVERSGAFRANLVGAKEVSLIRAPAEGSLEQVEPIAISRNWEDQLHYDIVISGKSFPLGTQVPVAFKLTPLAKVQCHRIKVLVTENIEYFCSGKRVHRMEPTRKIQLFEKRADGAPVSAFPGSSMRVTAGGGIPYEQRANAARGDPVLSSDPSNLLGNLEGDSNIGPTEMEFNVQLPSCHAMKDRDPAQRLHFDTTYQNIQVHHWIKIVMRLSKPDATDPKKRRHFEISIDSPFHILSCRATQANISLPAYTNPNTSPMGSHLFECGCPGAARRRDSPPSILPTLSSFPAPSSTNLLPPSLTRPPTIHPATHLGRLQSVERPIHLLRAPSFNPPAFSEEDPPPPLITPPPQYDSIASPTHGLADYFSRLSDTYDEDEDSPDDDPLHRTSSRRPPASRVTVPLTPGGRVNRSMDLTRSWVPVGGLS